MSLLSVSQCYCFDGHLAGGHCCQRSGSFGTSLATAPGRFSVFALPSHIGYSDSIGANEVICVCSFFSDRYCNLPRQLTCKLKIILSTDSLFRLMSMCTCCANEQFIFIEPHVDMCVFFMSCFASSAMQSIRFHR